MQRLTIAQFIARWSNSEGSGQRWSLGTVVVLLALVAQQVVARQAQAAAAAKPPFALASLAARPTPTVAVLFRLSDCSSLIEALRHWNGAAASGAVRVRGVVLDTREDSAALHDALGGSGIGYSVSGNPDSTIARTLARLGHFTTPVAVVLDPQGQVRMVVPAPDVTSRTRIREVLGYAASLAELTGGPASRPASP